jgi:hypothetical protein
LIGVVYSGVTNPYSKLGTTEPVYSYRLDSTGQFILEEKRRPRFFKTPFFFNYFSLQSLQAMFRIAGDAWFFIEEPLPGRAPEIIAQIHQKRFDTSKPYVISGHHFSELYTRNLGIFYNAALDPRFALSEKDWVARQQSITSTLAFHLAILNQAGKEYTTFYPIWPNIYSGVNVYAEPSDSLFAIVYTLRAMTDSNFIAEMFPATGEVDHYPLQTKRIGNELLEQYRLLLQQQVENYLADIINPDTGLVRRDILLSSARDQIKRESSFYDNVIAWSTTRMAAELGLQVQCPAIFQINGSCDFVKWKEHIINAFWDEGTGIFLDDLSTLSQEEKSFSADSLIVISTGFLDVTSSKERKMLMQIHDYIVTQGLDKPLPLRYAVKNQYDRLYPLVRACAPSYVGETHWSHWGMEYIKSLILLSKYDQMYMEKARTGLEIYRQKIEEFGGYPELYDSSGSLYETWFYKGLLHTGWVVNYEQALMMMDN